MQPPIPNPTPHHRHHHHSEFLKPLLTDSTKQFLAQHRTGRTDFSDFESIFTRLLQDHHPDPPPELLWFYSAVVFHSSKQDFGNDSVRLTRSLFQMLVPLSEPFSGAKRAAMLSPLVYNLIRLVKIRSKEEVLELLDGIVSYVIAYCGDDEQGGEDELLMVTGFGFADLSRVWVVDEEEVGDDCLEMFMPFVGERLRKEVESCTVGCLGGIVASQLLLLSLCLRFDSAELRRKDLLRESVVQMINGFHSCYFFDGILKMLLVEPYLRLTPLLGPEDEATLLETITEAVIESAESLFLNTGSGNSQRSLRLKNIAINWLFLFAKASIRKIEDQEETSRFTNMFSNSRIPFYLVNWVISQGEVIRYVDTLLNSTPASFIEWLVSLEEQGIQVFDCDYSKNYAKAVVIQWSRPDLSLEATLLKQQEEVDQDAHMADHHLVSSISINSSSSSTRKRKEERPDEEGETKMKFFKHRHNNFQEKSRFPPFVFSDQRLVNGTEVGVSDMEL